MKAPLVIAIALLCSSCSSELLTSPDCPSFTLMEGKAFQVSQSQLMGDSTVHSFVTGRILQQGIDNGKRVQKLELQYTDVIDTMTVLQTSGEVSVFSKPYNAWLRYSLVPGASSSYTIESSGLISTIAYTVAQRDTLVVNGESLACLVINQTEECNRMDASENKRYLTHTSTLWYAPSVGLFVKSIEDYQYAGSENKLHFESTLSL